MAQQEVTLTSPNISCQHCVAAIQKALSALPGVEVVGSDLEGKKVTVRYDPARTSLAQIERAMEEEGYPVAH